MIDRRWCMGTTPSDGPTVWMGWPCTTVGGERCLRGRVPQIKAKKNAACIISTECIAFTASISSVFDVVATYR